jgi:hypothetical protein
MNKKCREYTIAIWVQLKYTLTFPCIFCLNPNHNDKVTEFSCPFLTVYIIERVIPMKNVCENSYIL